MLVKSAFLLLWASTLAAEPLGTISGVILNSTTGAPLASSKVTLAHADGSPILTVNTDRRGRYIFTDLAAGLYAVRASRSNFAPGRYGQKSWNQVGAVINLAPGAGFTADILLHRLGVITGSVVDENGEGLPHLTVNAVSANASSVTGRVSSAGITDDRGAFRIPGLKPGRYYVATAPRQLEDGTGLLPTYYPNFLDRSESRMVVVEIDRETPDVQVQPIPGRLLRISGSVPAAARFRDAQVTVSLLREEEVRQTSTGPGGQFGFSEVVPGNYTVIAELKSAETRLAAYQPIAILNDLEGVALNTGSAPEVQVRIVDEKGAEVNDPQFMVFAGRIENAVRIPPVRVEGHVSLVLMPGRWRLFVVCPETHVVDSVSAADQDALEGFTLLPGRRVTATIRVVRRAGKITGQVTDANGLPARGVPVICFPLDPRNRYRLGGFRSAKANLSGEYRFGGLPEGDYLVAATAQEDFNPEEALEELKSRLPTLKISASVEMTQNLRLPE